MKALYNGLKITAIFLTISSGLFSQIILGPSIGLTAEPADNTPICNIPTYIDPDMTFESPGLQNGDTVPHFKLYKTNGDSVDLLTELQAGKPILLVGGSITCNVFRGKINDINTLATTYVNDIKVFVVYIVEAHPVSPDLSPYSGTVWVPAANVTDNCLFNQPTTYGQRKDLADTTDARYSIIPDIIVDGACNLWWSTFATAPNSAFLITPTGKLFKKHGWFNRAPMYNMANDIDSLLATLSIQQPTLPAIHFNVFPNPASDVISITLEGNTSSGDLSLMDNLGRVVKSVTLNAPTTQLNISDLSSGVYFYSFAGEGVLNKGKILVH